MAQVTVGRTTWWPCDAAEHDRELTVELAEEFGPAAHAVTRVLKDLAQQQRADGRVRAGFRVLAAKCHLAIGSDSIAARALARVIVERAAEIGWADELELDDDGRRFTLRVSGWMADQTRGREAIKKASQRRGGDTSLPKGTSVRDMPGLPGNVGVTGAHVPSGGDVSRSVPLTEQTIEEEPPNPLSGEGPVIGKPPGGNRQRDLERWRERAAAIAEQVFPGAPLATATKCVEQAAKYGDGSLDAIHMTARFFPELLAEVTT